MRKQGFTLVEVMVSLGVMTVGALSLVAMQQQTMRANGRSRDMTTAIQIAQTVIERLKLQGLSWNTIGTDGTEFDKAPMLKKIATATAGEFMTLPEVPDTRGDVSRIWANAFDLTGADVPLSIANDAELARVRFCASYRLSWIYDTRHRALRADVRVWWSKEAPTRSILADSDFPQCADNNAKLLPGGEHYDDYHVVYLSTVLRVHPI
jgi:prepilin-type N-terminal cleavage/methylation domain-containing protein